MIDSIRISVFKEFNQSMYNFLLYSVDNRTTGFILNNKTKRVERQEIFVHKSIEYEQHETIFLNGRLKVPSSIYNIAFRVHEDRVDLEFSLPKFIYGTNVLELRGHINRIQSPYDLLINSLKKFFRIFFPSTHIDYGGIEIKRWDFCFNQVFNSEEESLRALKYIKLKNNQRMDKLNFETGYVELTKSNYFKIYHKGTEFEKNDYLKLDLNFDPILNFSKKILRFEKKITISNIAYWYNVKYKHQYQPELVKLYLKAKRKGTVNKVMRADFENVQRFTIGNSKIQGATKLMPFVFNHLYDIFRQDIKRKYTIGKMSVAPLRKEVCDNTKNRTQKIRILSLIKVFKSLKRAYEMGAISKNTYYRYEKLMKDNDYSTTNISVDIKQDWTENSYFSELYRNCIIPIRFSRDCMF